MVVPEGALNVSRDGRQAALEIRGTAVVDQPGWPQRDTPTYAARTSFKVKWTATGEAVTYQDPVKQFRVVGWKATTQLEAEVEVPELGFSWHSDPLESSSAAFGVIGEEANGRYYHTE
jgi:hypothetical protein